jgi:hypothetical protein
MTVGVLLIRRSFIKVLGSVIQALLDRGHRTVLFWDASGRVSKAGDTLTEADLAAWPGAETVRYDPASAERLFRQAGLDALVSTELYSYILAGGLQSAFEAIRAAGVHLYSVSHIFDTAWSDPAGYRLLERTFYVSDYQRDLHWRMYADDFAAVGPRPVLEARSAVTGSPMLDQLAAVDPVAARRRYDLPEGRPVVVFMSLKMAVPDPWRRLVWGRGPRLWRAARAALAGRRDLVPAVLHGAHYRDLVAAVRRLCDRAGALLVVKCKGKNDDPPFLRRVADLYVDDRSVYPYTSLELLSLASLCVHFESGAALEAAFAGVPALSIAVSQAHLARYPGIDELYGGRPGSLQNFAGVSELVPAAEAVGRLDARRLDDFTVEPDARARYVRTFLGFDDTKSGQRILDVMER